MPGLAGVHFGRMDGVVSDIAATTTAINARLDALAPLSAAWTGEAYQRAHEELADAARRSGTR